MKSYAIGIAGGTGSGKTTVAKELVAAFPQTNVVYLSFDHYYKDLSHLSLEERKQQNFDHPDALEASLLVSHLTSLKEGKSIHRPCYDFVSHTRTKETEQIMSAPVIVLEGILVFAYPELRNLLDMKVFVDTESDVRFIRRLIRDIKERGRTTDAVITQYMHTVRPMHRDFVEPTKRFADIIIPEGRNDVALRALIATVKEHISSRT